jgi:hypothetical protein
MGSKGLIRNPMKKLTDYQRELCATSYPVMLDVYEKFMAWAQSRGWVLDADAVLEQFHDRLIRAAATQTGREVEDFDGVLSGYLHGWWRGLASKAKWQKVTEIPTTTTTQGHYDYEQAMDELGLTEGREEFESVVWHGGSKEENYGPNGRREWERVRSRVQAVMS